MMSLGKESSPSQQCWCWNHKHSKRALRARDGDIKSGADDLWLRERMDCSREPWKRRTEFAVHFPTLFPFTSLPISLCAKIRSHLLPLYSASFPPITEIDLTAMILQLLHSAGRHGTANRAAYIAKAKRRGRVLRTTLHEMTDADAVPHDGLRGGRGVGQEGDRCYGPNLPHPGLIPKIGSTHQIAWVDSRTWPPFHPRARPLFPPSTCLFGQKKARQRSPHPLGSVQPHYRLVSLYRGPSRGRTFLHTRIMYTASVFSLPRTRSTLVYTAAHCVALSE